MTMEQPEGFSINRLATELDVDRRTLARRLQDVEPIGTGPKGAPLYRLSAALAALDRHPVQREPRHHTRDGVYISLAETFCIERSGKSSVLSGEDICRMYGWRFDELAELLNWGAPAIKCGSPSSVRGWLFAFPSFSRWYALLAMAIHREADGRLPYELRRQRGARPLVIPRGFKEFAPSNEDRDADA